MRWSSTRSNTERRVLNSSSPESICRVWKSAKFKHLGLLGFTMCGQIVAIGALQQLTCTPAIAFPQLGSGHTPDHGYRDHGATGFKQFFPSVCDEWLIV